MNAPRPVLYVGVAVLAVGLAFWLGRSSKPAEIITETKTETVYQDRLVEVGGQSQEVVKVVERVKVVQADGSSTETETERTETKSDAFSVVDHNATVTVEQVAKKTERSQASARLSLAVEATPSALLTPSVRLGGGLRLGNTPLWLEGSIAAEPRNPLKTLRFGVGLAVEF